MTRKIYSKKKYITNFIVFFLFSPIIHANLLTTNHDRKTVTQQNTLENFTWKSAYDIELTNKSLNIYLNIRLIKSDNISNYVLKQKEQTWLDKIDSVWNNKFGMKQDNKIVPIKFFVSFRAPSYHHEVILKSGSGTSDQLDWKIDSDPSVIAHEIAHMMGLYDEYKGGALNPNNSLIDSTSIMFNDPKKGVAKERHFEPFRKWVEKNIGGNKITLVPIN